MSSSPFEFHRAMSKRLREGTGEEALRSMLNELLEQFFIHAPENLRRGQATSEAAVFPAGPREYYAVVMIGPCENLGNSRQGNSRDGERGWFRTRGG